MKQLLFVYDLEEDSLWADGLQASLKLLEKDFKIDYLNLAKTEQGLYGYDFILGWGAFGSKVDNYLTNYQGKKGLCLGGNATQVPYITYDVIFYETKWVKDNYLNRTKCKSDCQFVHAFGTNTDIYKPMDLTKVYDYLTVGSFSLWKNQRKLIDKYGVKIAIGQIQRGNLSESLSIIGDLLFGGVIVSNSLLPKDLVKFYNMSKKVYLPCDIVGGGERAVLEAKACGIPVEVENKKLQELANNNLLWDHHYYYKQLKKGIKYAIQRN